MEKFRFFSQNMFLEIFRKNSKISRKISKKKIRIFFWIFVYAGRESFNFILFGAQNGTKKHHVFAFLPSKTPKFFRAFGAILNFFQIFSITRCFLIVTVSSSLARCQVVRFVFYLHFLNLDPVAIRTAMLRFSP